MSFRPSCITGTLDDINAALVDVMASHEHLNDTMAFRVFLSEVRLRVLTHAETLAKFFEIDPANIDHPDVFSSYFVQLPDVFTTAALARNAARCEQMRKMVLVFAIDYIELADTIRSLRRLSCKLDNHMAEELSHLASFYNTNVAVLARLCAQTNVTAPSAL